MPKSKDTRKGPSKTRIARTKSGKQTKTIQLLLRDVPTDSLVPFDEGDVNPATRNARILRLFQFFSEPENRGFLRQILDGSKSPVETYAEQAEILWFGDVRFSQDWWHLAAAWYNKLLEIPAQQRLPAFERVAMYRLGWLMYEIGIEHELAALAEVDTENRAALFQAARRSINHGMDYNRLAVERHRNELGSNCTYNQACGLAIRARVTAEESILMARKNDEWCSRFSAAKSPNDLNEIWGSTDEHSKMRKKVSSSWRTAVAADDVREIEALRNQSIGMLYKLASLSSGSPDGSLDEWHFQAQTDSDLMILRADDESNRQFEQWSQHYVDSRKSLNTTTLAVNVARLQWLEARLVKTL